MSRLVAYYSRTGYTEKLGQNIAEKLGADTEKIEDLENRHGIIKFLKACVDGYKGKKSDIRYEKGSDEYDTLIIGTPVWAGKMTPAVRTYLEQNDFKEVAFFCTCGKDKAKTFKDMEKICGKPKATLAIKDQEVESSENEIEQFCRAIEGSKD